MENFISHKSTNKSQIASLASHHNYYSIIRNSIAELLPHSELPANTARESWKRKRGAMYRQSKPKLKTRSSNLTSYRKSQTQFSIEANHYEWPWSMSYNTKLITMIFFLKLYVSRLTEFPSPHREHALGYLSQFWKFPDLSKDLTPKDHRFK